MIVEAALMLAVAGLTLMLLPFKRYVWWLKLGGSSAAIDPATATRVGRAVRLGASNVPWNAVCLPQAMAAAAMLARRGYGSALYVGVVPSPKGAMNLHAWLEVDGIIIVGGPRAAAIVPVVRFG